MNQQISEIIIGERFRKDVGELSSLVSSIKEVGLLHPIVISEKNELIAGYRRLKAAKLLGWQTIPVTVVSLNDLRKGEMQENTIRKNFSLTEDVAVYRYFELQVKIEADQRQKSGVQSDKPLGNFPEGGRSLDVLGSYVGKSGKTLEKEITIVEAAESNPEKFLPLQKKVEQGKISVNAANIQIKRATKHENTPELPQGEFDVIYADPPWKYDFSLRGDPTGHYAEMEIDEICNLKIPTASNTILFLWATNPKLKEALQVLESWGFTYKTNMVWVKDKIGTGYYARGQHELLLIGTKGNIGTPLEQDRPPSVVNAKRGEHSQKPIEVYNIIEKMYPNHKYLELFARNNREGWVSWGNEL